jgi:hypothetical protein
MKWVREDEVFGKYFIIKKGGYLESEVLNAMSKLEGSRNVSVNSSWKTVLSNKAFWLDYFFFYELISDEWAKRLEYEGACHFPELGVPVRFPLTNEAGLMLELGQSLPDVTLKVYDASCPEGIRIGHYDDGHPCNFVFRWEELVEVSEHLSKQVPECPAAPFILLSVFGPPTAHDDWAEVKSRVRRASVSGSVH